MSKMQELMEKRAKTWEGAKAFLDTHRKENGTISAEDNATYEKMEADVVALGKEIDRLKRQKEIDAELSKATSTPITDKPQKIPVAKQTKTGRATDEYRKAFWNQMRKKNYYDVANVLTIGEDAEGGYLVPDEYEKKLVEGLEEEVFFRKMAHVIQTSSGDRSI